MHFRHLANSVTRKILFAVLTSNQYQSISIKNTQMIRIVDVSIKKKPCGIAFFLYCLNPFENGFYFYSTKVPSIRPDFILTK
jgi:hypothetical protein